MLTKLKSVRKTHLIYCAIAIFYFWMAAQIPYTHDDWDWGLDIGLHQWLHATVNSRYAGNFFEIIMTRSELVKIIVMGSAYFLVPFLLSHLAMKLIPNASKKTRLTLFLLANCLLLSMDRMMWRQTYGWVAGYANFVISALFMMPWIDEIISAFSNDHADKKTAPQFLFLYFFLSLTSQLFLENVALFHVLLGIFLSVFHYVQNRKIPARTLVMVIGSIIGLLIMFSSSIYDTLLTTGSAVDNYRQIPLLADNSLSETLLQTVRTIVILGIGLYADNYFLCLFILVCLSCLLVNHQRTTNDPWGKRLFFGNIAYSVILTVWAYADHISLEGTNYLYAFVVSVTFFLLATIELIYLFKSDRRQLYRQLVIWLSAPMLIAPLALTTVVGSRLFFSSNLFLILLALVLFGHIALQPDTNFFNKSLKIVSFLIAGLLICHGFVYAQIGYCKHIRNARIREAIVNESMEIILPAFPYSDYLHFPDPAVEIRLDFFKEFYGIPEHVDVIFDTEE